jgi:lysylphosphatidylglycerol synthetase-like protein (DUF2156 family)
LTAASGASAPANQNIAGAITDVSERALLLVHEEIELAKAEISEKLGKILKGTIVAVAAGVFVLAAIQFVLAGLALLAWWGLPFIGQTEFFWGFFIVAAALLALAVLAGVVAAKAVKAGSPPVPSMAVEEARKIRGAVAAGQDAPNVAHGAEPGAKV